MLKIKGTQLQEVMNFLDPSFGVKTQNQYSKAILVSLNKEENTINFRVNNGLVESTVTLVGGEYEIEKSVEFCVDEFIQNVVSRLKKDLNFIVKEDEQGNEILVVESGKKEYHYGLLDTQKFPKPIELDSKIKYVLVDDRNEFFNNFKYTSFCASERPTISAYKSFDLRSGKLAATDENVGMVIQTDMGESNPPAKEMLSVLTAYSKLDDEDEIFYSFGRDIVVTKASRKDMDVQYVFVPIEDSLPNKFFEMIETYSAVKPYLQFTIDEETIKDAIEQAVIYATKAAQEGHPTYTTIGYDGKDIRFMMDIPNVSNFNFDIEVTDLETDLEEYKIHIDPVDFTKFISTVGGDITMRFFEPDTLFMCTSTVHPDLIYFQTTVRLRKEEQ